MHLMLLIGRLGQYKADIPDFMVFLEFEKRFPETGGLPPHWLPFKSFGFCVRRGDLGAGDCRLDLRLACLSVPHQGRLLLDSQPGPHLRLPHVFRNDFTFGNNGLTDFKFILGADVNSAETKRWLYIASAILLLGTYLLCRWLTSTKFGLIQRAIRDSENRVLFSGYSTASFKLFVFVLSAVLAGLGGALYVPQVGIINPSEMAPTNRSKPLFGALSAVAARCGPILGAVSVNALKVATRAFAEQWLYILSGPSLFPSYRLHAQRPRRIA